MIPSARSAAASACSRSGLMPLIRDCTLTA